MKDIGEIRRTVDLMHRSLDSIVTAAPEWVGHLSIQMDFVMDALRQSCEEDDSIILRQANDALEECLDEGDEDRKDWW